MNNKGMSTWVLFLYVFVVFFFMVFFGITILGFNLVNNALNQDVDIGQVNLQETNGYTFGKIADAMVHSADMIAIIFIFGMILLMMANAYFFGDSNKLWIPIDVFILVFVFILARYMSSIYSTLINSTDILSVYADSLPKTSTFLLNLPIYIPVIGAIIMIITYSGINRDDPRGGVNINEY